jgi:hypothetical protein
MKIASRRIAMPLRNLFCHDASANNEKEQEEKNTDQQHAMLVLHGYSPPSILCDKSLNARYIIGKAMFLMSL